MASVKPDSFWLGAADYPAAEVRIAKFKILGQFIREFHAAYWQTK